MTITNVKIRAEQSLTGLSQSVGKVALATAEKSQPVFRRVFGLADKDPDAQWAESLNKEKFTSREIRNGQSREKYFGDLHCARSMDHKGLIHRVTM